MKIEKVIVGPLFTNCYLVSEKNQTLIIDPGAEPEKIFSLIPSPVSLIVATHVHPDHIGAVWAIKHEFPQAKFLLHQADLPILKNLHFAAKFFPGYGIQKPPAPDGFLEEEKLSIFHYPFSIIHTPGHSPGGICLKIGNTLFTGDTLFAQGVGRTDFPYGDEKQLLQSLKKLSKLPEGLIIYPGHGESSTLKQALEPLSGLLEES